MAHPRTERTLAERLEEGLRELHLELSNAQRERLLQLVAMLARWNRRFNLTAVRDPAWMIGQHLLDSLAILPYLQGTRVLDLGSGPGFPGLPLAIARPPAAFTLLDSNGKKTRFAQQAIIELGLSNVRVVRERAEDFRPPEGFDTITVRAFAALSDILELARPLLRRDGLLLALKGRRPDREFAVAELAASWAQLIRLRVPQVEGDRHLIMLRLHG